MHWFPNYKTLSAYIVLTLPVLAIQYAFPRTAFYLFITCFTLSFASYFFILKKKLQPDFKLGLIIRIALLFGLPTLSDDLYRFYWDGLLMLKGINPYGYLPENNPLEFGEKSMLLEQMNSPQYYSPYTPVLQLLFAFCAWLGGSLFGFVVVLRMCILSAEILIFFMLKKLISQSWKLNIWWLNPLVILEFTGNLHQEVFVVLGLVGFFYLQDKKKLFAITAYALAVLTKLIPLIYLPAFFRVFSFKKFFSYALAAITCMLVSYFFFFSEENANNYLQSLGYYFSVFEFNSSVYRVAQYLKDYVWGPLIYLPKIVALLAFTLLGIFGPKKLENAMLWCLTVFMLCSQSVHPWYVAPLILFSVLGDYRFPVIWSFLIGWTYITYETDPYQQNVWIIAVEYLVIIVVTMKEILKKNKLKNRFLFHS